MPLIARQDDISCGSNCNVGLHCCPHEWCGPIQQVANRTIVEGQLIARIGDIGSCNCPHGGIYQIIDPVAVRSHAEGPRIARIGDNVQCLVCGDIGTIITSASRSHCE